VSGSLFLLVSVVALYLVVRGGSSEAVLPPVSSDFGGIDQFGRELFSYALVPFELSSALLMVAVIGAVAVARGNHVHARKRDSLLKAPDAAKVRADDAELARELEAQGGH
jgi:NADH-quinone oxidoreductase subunit J